MRLTEYTAVSIKVGTAVFSCVFLSFQKNRILL